MPENPDNSKNNVVVTVGAKGYNAEVTAGNHSFVLDEPKSLGGQDAGPKPEDMILSALGACTAITLRMYADRKSWPLEKIDVMLKFSASEENHENAETNENEAKRKISGEVHVHGNLTPEQVNRLNEIAHKCPVHKSLLPAYNIEITTIPAAPEYQ